MDYMIHTYLILAFLRISVAIVNIQISILGLQWLNNWDTIVTLLCLHTISVFFILLNNCIYGRSAHQMLSLMEEYVFFNYSDN